MRKNIAFIIIVLISCFDAVGCDCWRGRITVKDFNSYDWIFVGTLVSESRSEQRQYSRTATYKIIKAYKGVSTEDTVRVSDAESIGACGLGRLAIGGDYLIYARGNEEKWTSNCTGSTAAPSHFELPDSARTYFQADTLFLQNHVSKIQNGTSQKFYDEVGKISAEGVYKAGLPEGRWKYFERGEFDSEGKYSMGKKDSWWIEQGFKKGAVEIVEFKAGEFTYKNTSIVDGIVTSKTEPIGDGQKWIKYNYYDNGQVRYIAYANPPRKDKRGRLRDAQYDGPFKLFNRTGVVLEEGNFENGAETGHWKYYYENGKLRMEGDYIQLREHDYFALGQKSGLWKIYYQTGKTKAVGNYTSNEKVGVWQYFDKNGKVISTDPKLIEDDEDPFTYSGYKK